MCHVCKSLQACGKSSYSCSIPPWCQSSTQIMPTLQKVSHPFTAYCFVVKSMLTNLEPQPPHKKIFCTVIPFFLENCCSRENGIIHFNISPQYSLGRTTLRPTILIKIELSNHVAKQHFIFRELFWLLFIFTSSTSTELNVDTSAFHFRNFRTALEYDLHMFSHAYVTHLKVSSGRDPRKKARSSAFDHALRIKKASIRRLLPKRKPSLQPPEEVIEAPSASVPENDNKTKTTTTMKKSKKSTLPNGKTVSTSNVNTSQNNKKSDEFQGWQSCKLKLKIPMIKQDKIPMLKLTPLKISPSDVQSFANNPKSAAGSSSSKGLKKGHPQQGRKRKASSSSPSSTNQKLTLKIKSPTKKKIKLDHHSHHQAQAVQHQSSPRPSSSNTNKKPTIEESLTCPTCDKVFVAKSILERHLKKSKHGMFVEDKDVTAPPPLISQALDKAMAEGRQLPHLNTVTQPKIEVGGREVNKYECHLCNQVFLRVKDLAKHRERMMCSALFSFK